MNRVWNQSSQEKMQLNEKIEPNLRVIAGGFEPYQNPNKVL